jgi:hypothetical protein
MNNHSIYKHKIIREESYKGVINLYKADHRKENSLVSRTDQPDFLALPYMIHSVEATCRNSFKRQKHSIMQFNTS